MDSSYENFTEEQLRILKKYVTNTTGSIFALRNLPEVIKGALFSRYSRSSLGLRALLLKEFVLGEETSFASISAFPSSSEGEEERFTSEGQLAAIKKAQNFYDRILDGYGDDSIGELGGAHLAIENISMLAAKAVEDARIGGSPLEKSTRYIYFDQKHDGEYLFYREPILMASAYRDIYIDTCNYLFSTYSRLIPPMMEKMEQLFPKQEEVSKVAYTAALKAKVFDCLRGLLPAGCLTNMGVYGNGRFFETLIQKLHTNSLSEMQDVGKRALEELVKVIPSFVRRADPSHKYHKSFTQFSEQMQMEIKRLASLVKPSHTPSSFGVHLVEWDEMAPKKVAAALLFGSCGSSLEVLRTYCQDLSDEAIGEILEAACYARENRRHKSPRALEHAYFTFEIIADFGVYRDLQRHRMLTQERQPLTCQYGYFMPQEILGMEIEAEYALAMEKAKKTYDILAKDFPEEAQYVVPMGYNMRWYFHVNLRGLQWLCELRASQAGHPTYRFIAQEMARQVSAKIPAFERFFKFVDYEGSDLGRLGQEIRTAEKLARR